MGVRNARSLQHTDNVKKIRAVHTEFNEKGRIGFRFGKSKMSTYRADAEAVAVLRIINQRNGRVAEMVELKTSGKTVLKVYGDRGPGFYVSIVSRRAARFVLRRSLEGKWRHPFSELVLHYSVVDLGITIAKKMRKTLMKNEKRNTILMRYFKAVSFLER